MGKELKYISVYVYAYILVICGCVYTTTYGVSCSLIIGTIETRTMVIVLCRQREIWLNERWKHVASNMTVIIER